MNDAKRAPPQANTACSRGQLERIPAIRGAALKKSVVDREGCHHRADQRSPSPVRSNAGKSSSINRLAGQTRLAYASQNAGPDAGTELLPAARRRLPHGPARLRFCAHAA